jgi:hypothetical protein
MAVSKIGRKINIVVSVLQIGHRNRSLKQVTARGMPFSGILGRLDIVRTDGSEEPGSSITMVTRIGSMLQLLVTANVVPTSTILVTLMMEALGSSETSVIKKQDVSSQKTPFF